MDGVVNRAIVYRYKASGKLVAVISHGRGSCMVLSVADDLRSINKVTSRKYVKSDLLETTRYQIEIKERSTKQPDGIFYSYQLIRVLTSDDTDLKRWEGTSSLQSLPISSETGFTPEEHHWTGVRPGNLGGGIALAAVTVALVFAAVTASGGGVVFFSLLAIPFGWLLFRYKWHAPVPASPERVSALMEYKTALREQAESYRQAALTSVESSLLEKKTWDDLSPEHFESALAIRLKKLGFEVRATRYSKDGGVDIHAIDSTGRQTIVQAKKYAGNVGVAAVREMIGVRESSPDRPHAIIYSLNGFSRDARALAKRTGIELRDIKSELLPMSNRPPF